MDGAINDANTIFIKLSLISPLPSFRALESPIFGELQADYLALRTRRMIRIGAQVLFIPVFGLMITLIYVLKPFLFAIGIITDYLLLASRRARFKRHFGDCLNMRRGFCWHEI